MITTTGNLYFWKRVTEGSFQVEEYAQKWGGMSISGSMIDEIDLGDASQGGLTGISIEAQWTEVHYDETEGTSVVVGRSESVNVSFENDDTPTKGNGPGDPPAKGSEFNINFTLGPQVGFQLGDFLNLDLRLWTFGAISSKDNLKSKEFHDGKLTSEHSFTFGLFGLSFGKGMEHKIGYRGGDEPFTDTDFLWLNTLFGTTTKTDQLGNVVERQRNNTIFGISPLLFSIEITKDPK